MGEIARGKAPALTGYQDRQARTVLAGLIKLGVLGYAAGPGEVALPDGVAAVIVFLAALVGAACG
jgi:hypothetical protein